MNGPALSPSEWRATLAGLFAVALVGAAAAALFTMNAGIDVTLSALFTDESGRFFLAHHPLFEWINGRTRDAAILASAIALFGLAFTLVKRRSFWGRSTRDYLFFVLSLALAPGVVANILLKNQWGRARPRELIEFGGALHFTPPLSPADQCATNCSFVAGDAALVFALVAFALAATWRRPLWIVLTIVSGFLIGLVRIAQGAHFASDVVFAFVVVLAIVLLLKLVVVDTRRA